MTHKAPGLASLLGALALALAAAPARAQDAAAPAATPPPATGAAPAPAAETEDVTKKKGQGELADRIRPVSGNLFYKAGRVELTPGIGMSLADAFFQKYSVGAKVNYHIVESFAVGLHGSYSLDFAGGAVSVCRPECTKPAVADMKDVPGNVDLIAGLDLSWAPIYGKLSVMAERVLHFDTALIAGVSGVRYGQPGGSKGFGVAPTVGIGQRYFLTPNATLRVEVRDYIYNAKTVNLGGSAERWENQIMFDLGVSFFVGGAPQQ